MGVWEEIEGMGHQGGKEGGKGDVNTKGKSG